KCMGPSPHSPSKARLLPITPELFLESCQSKQLLWKFVVQNKPRHHLAQRGTMLESVSRSPAQQPGIFAPRMTVNDEVVVRTVLILADTSLKQRRIFQGRKTKGDVVAND